MSGKQQRRELCGCGHGIEDHYRASTYCTSGWACPGSIRCVCDLYRPAPSYTPSARDSGRDEAREAVARWLADTSSPTWEEIGPTARGAWRHLVDRLIRDYGPELTALLRDGDQR